jgi:hypothetical protein
MNRSAAVVLVTSCAVLLSACGMGAPLGDGKAGAAKAAYTALRPANDSSSGSSWDPLSAAGQPIDVGLSTEVKGKEGGKAIVRLDVSTDSLDAATNVKVGKNIEFQDFSDDGKTRYNGTLRADLLVSTDGTSATVKYAVKGRITLSGVVDDVLDIDTTIDVATTDFQNGTGSASVKLKGTIGTRSGLYHFNDESLQIDVAGDLPADVSVSR